MASSTVAKVMYLDRLNKAFVVEVEDIRYDRDSLRDHIEFVSHDDYEKEHNYFIKWRDCPMDCEEEHHHSGYYPGRILCLAGKITSFLCFEHFFQQNKMWHMVGITSNLMSIKIMAVTGFIVIHFSAR